MQVLLAKMQRHLFLKFGARKRNFSCFCAHRAELPDAASINTFLSTPSWSVRSLIPSESQIFASSEVRPTQLRHLLRLSALQAPTSVEEETRMLCDLHSQLQFVRQMQKVGTDNVEPLRSLQDESAEAKRSQELRLEAMKEALENEEVVGQYHKRIRRRKTEDLEARKAEDWNVTGQAKKKVGRYLVVESGESEG